MARRRGRRRRRSGFKIPIFSLAIVGGQAALAVAEGGGLSNPLGVLDRFQDKYTGISFSNKDFNPSRLLIGWGPWAVKGLVSKMARSFGAVPRVPFGLPISFS